MIMEYDSDAEEQEEGLEEGCKNSTMNNYLEAIVDRLKNECNTLAEHPAGSRWLLQILKPQSKHWRISTSVMRHHNQPTLYHVQKLTMIKRFSTRFINRWNQCNSLHQR
jgi:hypothetical protein